MKPSITAAQVAEIVSNVADFLTRCRMAKDFATEILKTQPDFNVRNFYRACGIGINSGQVVLTKEGTR